uniref:VIT domain-containing protein n=1 Tax=Sinocyclocheilus rhinocerous TaxID=307959 RepID=A0A673GW06_9TELE
MSRAKFKEKLKYKIKKYLAKRALIQSGAKSTTLGVYASAYSNESSIVPPGQRYQHDQTLKGIATKLLKVCYANRLCKAVVLNQGAMGPQQTPKEVQSMKVDCKVASRFAHTVMTTKALNKANISQEVSFEVELPKTSFITNFSMSALFHLIYVVKEKKKAKQPYQKAVSSGQTAGLVKASGRKIEKFSVSVNVAADSSVKFILTHEELLQRHFGKYELMIRVKPNQLVQHFEVHY